MLKTTFLLVLLATMYEASEFTFEEMEANGCTYKMTAKDLDADVILGALFPVHSYKLNKKLGEKYDFNTHAMAWIESFLYSISEINRNNTLLPGVKLGFDIRDSCNDEELGLNTALNFMLDTTYFRNTTDNSSVIKDNSTMCVCRKQIHSVLGAVVGGFSSPVSILMADILGADFIPQVSYASTSPTLGNSTIYRSFLRTTPSDLYQMQAITDLLYHFNFTYVSALASDNDDGRQALDTLRQRMREKGMCLAIDQTFDTRLPGDDLEKMIKKLEKVVKVSNVVVLWCQISEAMFIMQEVYKRGLRNITWIAPDIWGSDTNLRKRDNIHFTNGLISLKLKDNQVPAFMTYFSQIKYYSSFVNPWLPKLWDILGICPPTDPKPPNCFGGGGNTLFLPKSKHESVMAAVYAIAHGLHKLFKCQEVNGKYICPEKHKIIDYKRLFKYIKEAKFTIPSNKHVFKFNNEGDVAFSSYAFQILTNRRRFSSFGKWNGDTGNITIDEKKISWKNNTTPIAVCSHACLPGSYVIEGSVTCCWKCLQCGEDQISTKLNQRQCHRCKQTEMSDSNHTMCLALENKHLSIYTSVGQILCAVSLIGVLATLFVLITFIKYWETPVVKSSSREMCMIQLTSILLLFCLPIIQYLHLSKALCVVNTTSFGILYSQTIAFIVIKTYRLLRVFRKKRFSKISKFLQNRYQILLSFFLVLLLLIAMSIWYINHKPHIQIEQDRKDTSYVTYCGEDEDTLLYGVIGYIFFLSLISGFMAFRARKLPQNFNECQFIWFAMFTTCLAWLLFVPLYLSLERSRKPLVFLSINFVSNAALLLILYGYKISIIFFYPDLNSKENFRKMAANVTVTTFLQDSGKTNGAKRAREQSVISFDFQSMFDSYRKRQDNPSSLTTQKTEHLKHFPSVKRLRSKLSMKKKTDASAIQRKKDKKNRTKTLEYRPERSTPVMHKSNSLDELKVYSMNSCISDNLPKETPDRVSYSEQYVINKHSGFDQDKGYAENPICVNNKHWSADDISSSEVKNKHIQNSNLHRVVAGQSSLTDSIDSDLFIPNTSSRTDLIPNNKQTDHQSISNEVNLAFESSVSMDKINSIKTETYL